MTEDRANILLVDDKPARLLTCEAILDRLDQNLVRASSGAEALARMDDDDFAAILLDVNMPDMDGFETAALIRSHPRGKHTPIIFVTGVHVTDMDQLRGYEMGAADYVYVPVIPEILRGKVQVLVQLYRQRLELSRLNERLLAANLELERAHASLKVENTRELEKLNSSLELANAQLRSEVGERRRAEALLKEAAQRKDEFIAILAHELRNPLSAIQSGVDLMGLADLPEATFTWARELLQRQCKHLVRLIDDLLDVSRVTTGRVQLQREIVSLDAIVQQSIDATRPLIEERGHDLIVEIEPVSLVVDADPVRLTQVFGNLLTNASKYMEAGGAIYVSVTRSGHAPPTAVICVRDRGAGLPAEMLERIFELFTQGVSARGRGGNGLGIGLALVRALVELHGGTVYAASDGPGSGCEFIVELPLSGATVASAPEPDSLTAPGGAPLRILIIDDNVDAAHGLALYLRQRSPHNLHLAHTGESGLKSAEEVRPDVVLLDIGLPDIDGYEVARRLRADVTLGRVPLIAITGFGAEVDRRRAEQAGFDQFLVRPVSHRALETLLADCASVRAAG
jgi:signal transduction histidine kinase